MDDGRVVCGIESAIDHAWGTDDAAPSGAEFTGKVIVDWMLIQYGAIDDYLVARRYSAWRAEV